MKYKCDTCCLSGCSDGCILDVGNGLDENAPTKCPYGDDKGVDWEHEVLR